MATTVLGVMTGETHSTPQHDLGTKYRDRAGTEWVYVQADTNAKTQYAVYIVTPAYSLTTAVDHSTLNGKVFSLGCPQVAFAASAYGWVAVEGPLTVKFSGAVSADVPLYTSSTAGSLDDASSSQTKIPGLKALADLGGAGNAACNASIRLCSGL